MTTSVCDIAIAETAKLRSCTETENGARIRTTCVFPSFEPVFVYIIRFGDGFIVHDAGETFSLIINHGQDPDIAKRVIRDECKRFDISFGERGLSLKIDAIDWLESAIVAVANTAASAARLALAEVSKKVEHDLADQLFQLLQPKLPRGALAKHFPYQGLSGRRYKFDLAAQVKDSLTLIQTVRPSAISLAAKYVALADVPVSDGVRKIAAHSGDLTNEDVLLLQNVAVVASPSGVSALFEERRIN